MKKAILFDMDGTLINTDKANYLAYKEAFERFGIEFNQKDFSKLKSKHYLKFIPEFSNSLKEEDLEKIHEIKKKIFSKYAKFGKPIIPVINFLKNSRERFKIALVTTSSRAGVDMWINYFEWVDFFDIIITGDDVQEKKPAPEAYNLALKKLGFSSEEAFALEDSEIGISSAKFANLDVVDIKKDLENQISRFISN